MNCPCDVVWIYRGYKGKALNLSLLKGFGVRTTPLVEQSYGASEVLLVADSTYWQHRNLRESYGSLLAYTGLSLYAGVYS